MVKIHAFLLKGGKLLDLGDLGTDPSMARGVNDRDDVVGTSSISEIVSHAVLLARRQNVRLESSHTTAIQMGALRRTCHQ